MWPTRQPALGWRGREKQSARAVTGAVGVGAVRARFTGAVVGFEEARITGWAAGLHTGGGQLHGALQVLATDFWHGPFVHELCLKTNK